jgi:hypothetical protein
VGCNVILVIVLAAGLIKFPAIVRHFQAFAVIRETWKDSSVVFSLSSVAENTIAHLKQLFLLISVERIHHFTSSVLCFISKCC